MSEWAFVWLVLFKMLVLTAFVFCYAAGGRRRKFLRRFVGGLVLAAGCVLAFLWAGTFRWYLLPVLGLYVPALCMGYGGETPWAKVARRFVYGAFLGLIGLGTSIALGSLILGLFQLALAVSASLVLGLINPVRAVDEEAAIALLSVALVPFMG